MAQAPQDGQNLKLVNHLKLIEDLWQKLYYVKWNPKSFAMLARLAQDMAQNVRESSDTRLINLVAQLEQHIKHCATVGEVLREVDRQRLTALIDGLRFILVTSVGASASDEPRTRPLLASQPEVFLITPEEESPLLAKLQDAGYRVRHISNLVEAEERLHERIPGAIIIDMDFPEGTEQTITLIAALRTEVGLRSPVLFLAERNDMSARLDSVRAGGNAYFSKPFDSD